MSDALSVIVNVFALITHKEGALLWACNLLRNLPVPEYGEHIKFQFICYCIELLIPINYKVWKSLICQVRLLPNRFAIEFHAVDCCFFWLHLWVYDKAHGFNRYSRETVTIEVNDGFDSHLP